MTALVPYTSDVDDNLRWEGFPFREGDIVISTRSKHGTTWMQRICSLLVFGSPDLPGPLTEISPWVDWKPIPLPELVARLEAQTHRRFLKTHTPLDGVPADPRATYVVVARDPLDARVSLYHQSRNFDRAHVAQLLGQEPPSEPAEEPPPLRDALLAWATAPASEWLDSRTGVLRHVHDAWRRVRRAESTPGDPRVVLVHFRDLTDDLEGQMRRLATTLAIDVPEDAWPQLVRAATFEQMRERGEELVPAAPGVFHDRSRFFRGGRLGEGWAELTPEELADFDRRCREEVPDEVVDWLLRPPPRADRPHGGTGQLWSPL